MPAPGWRRPARADSAESRQLRQNAARSLCFLGAGTAALIRIHGGGATTQSGPPRPLAAPRWVGQTARMLHLMKLAVGVRDVPHLRTLQAARAGADPPLRHVTRNQPRRAAEVIDGGSIYWVIGGSMAVRQRILDITPAAAAEGPPRTALLLDPALVAVAARAVRPFQGWRYLLPAAAPPDLRGDGGVGAETLPPALRDELRALGLL